MYKIYPIPLHSNHSTHDAFDLFFFTIVPYYKCTHNIARKEFEINYTGNAFIIIYDPCSKMRCYI